MARISRRMIEAADPAATRFTLWDEALPGFGLLVLPTGAKSYIFNYRNKHGRSRRATIGRVGTLTPDQARDIAEEWAAKVRTGGDPLAEKAAAREALTVSDLIDAYLESETYKDKGEATRQTDIGRIENHLRPLLGRSIVDEISGEEVKRAKRAIQEGKTGAPKKKTRPRGISHVRGGEGVARKSILLLGAIFNWGMAEKGVTNNPTIGLDLGRDGERIAVLTAEQYTSLFAAITALESEKIILPVQADAIRVLAITGARRSEITRVRWTWVDLKVGRITIPKHKTGRTTKKDRVIDLEPVAQEIIARQDHNGEFVFPATKGKGPLSLDKPWAKICARAKLPADFGGVHGLRHSIGSHLGMGGAQEAQIMIALGHRKSSTTQKYIHFLDTARSALAKRAAAPAVAGIAAAAGAKNAEVINLDKRRGGG